MYVIRYSKTKLNTNSSQKDFNNLLKSPVKRLLLKVNKNHYLMCCDLLEVDLFHFINK